MRRVDTTKRSTTTSDGLEILHRRVYRGRPDRLRKLDEARANEEIARKIRELRAAAGLTQAQLAKLIGTTASVICRLEDADCLDSLQQCVLHPRFGARSVRAAPRAGVVR